MPSEIHPAIDFARSHPIPHHNPDTAVPVVATRPPAPENDIVHFSRDDALHGGDEEESLAQEVRSVINTPVNPDKPVFNLAFVSAVGNNEAEVTVRTPFGKEVVKTMKSQELFMLERQKYGGMKMTEVASKREGTFGNKALTFIERTWKTTLGKPMHEVKERRVGGKLMIAAGVDTAITAEFDAVIDQKARERIGEQRNNWFKRLTGNIRDAGNEIIGREKDLHREKIKIASELRNEYLQDPSDSKHPYAELLNRDMVAREAVAEKFANTPVDFLGEHGDKAREVALAPDSPVAKFLQEKIFKKVIADAIAQSDAGTYDGKNGGISAKLRPELDKTLKDYFFSDEFTTWRNGLSPEEQKVFENSLTYTNNVLSQAETVLMPMVHDHLTYFKTNQDIDFDIKLKLGTGQFGPNNEVVGTSVFSKDRISKNASVYEKLRRSINGDQSKLYTQGDVGKGLKQEMMMAALNAVVSNEVAAAAAGALLGGTAKTLLRSSVAWLPILGSGLVAGGVSGAKEYANLGKMRERFGEQVAEGYTHPVGVNAVRAEALRKVDYHRVDLGLRSEQLQHVSKQLIEGDKSPETILQTLGYLADSKARVALSDKRHINLFHASTDTPSGRGVYQKQEALHTQARILATTKLHELLNGDDALRTEIVNKIGFIPTLTSEQILDGLSAFQGEFLEHGITLDVKIQEALKAVTSADVKSIVGQDKAFQKWRWKEVGKRAATSAVLAGATTGLFKLGMNEYNTLHEQAITTVEHKVHTIIDQSVTSHASPLSIGEVQDPNTHEILATMSAHIPKGTTLMADQHVPGAYDLVLTDQPHRVLVDNMTFTDGHLNMTNEIRDSLAHSHIDYHSVSTGEVTIGAPDSSFVGTETLRFGDLPGAHEAGFDQWFANTLNHSFRVNPEPQVAGQMVVERTTQINGLREMLYAWEDHEKFLGHLNNFRLVEEPGYHQVMHVDAVTGRYLSEPQANGFFMDNVPKILSTEEGHRKIADFINESVRMKLSGANMDQAHEIAYHMSYDGTPGTIPTPQEFEVLMKALGETTAETAAKKVATHDAWFTMADDLVDIQTVTTTEVINHTIPAWTDALSVSVGNSVPLEAPIGNIKTQEPDNSQRKGKGKGNGLEKRPDATVEKGKTIGDSTSVVRPVVTPTIIGAPKRVIDNNEDINPTNINEGTALRPDDPNEEPSLKIDNELDNAIAKLALELDDKDSTDEDNNESEKSEEDNKRKELSGKIILDAYTKFIPKLRAELKSSHEDREDWTKTPDQAWLSDRDLLKVADKYNLPMAFMRRQMYGGPHFIVLVKPPVKLSADKYKIEYYDPKADGIQSEEINLNDLSNEYNKVYLSNGARHGEVANDSQEGDDVVKLMSEANYDLTIPESVSKKYVTKSLTSKTQVGPDSLGDGHNCGPLVLLYAAQAAALQNKLKKEEVEKWENDYGYTLLNKEALS